MQAELREEQDQVSGLDVNMPNPGAGGIPGALVLYGNGPGLAGDIDSDIDQIDKQYSNLLDPLLSDSLEREYNALYHCLVSG